MVFNIYTSISVNRYLEKNIFSSAGLIMQDYLYRYTQKPLPRLLSSALSRALSCQRTLALSMFWLSVLGRLALCWLTVS